MHLLNSQNSRLSQNKNSNKKEKSPDLFLVGITAVLVAIGLVAIYDASVVAAFRDFNDKFYYFKNQLVWATLGTLALTFFAFFDYHRLLKIAPVALAGSVFLLLLVLVPHIGTKAYGARRWINIAGFTFQPSEFAKLTLIFYEATILSKFENYKIRLTDALIVLFLPAIAVIGLVLLQPDLGTALIFAGITIVSYFVANSPIFHFIITVPVLIMGSIAAIVTQPYRLSRFKAFLDPNFDPQGASYQINQILIALSTGGLLGVGIGSSRSKFAFIPEVHSDAIFAIITEELGFLGAVIIIGLFVILIRSALNIAINAADYSGKMLGLGIVSLIAIQSLFNLGSIVALVPLTGIPLPFISYGGSSLFVTMASIGILLNISRQKTERRTFTKN